MGWLSKVSRLFFFQTHVSWYWSHRVIVSVFPTMILVGAMKGMAQPNSRRVDIAMQNVDQLLWICQILQFLFLFCFEETLDSCKALRALQSILVLFLSHHNDTSSFQPNQQRSVFVTLDLDLCSFWIQKTRTEKCVYPMLHFSPDLDIQFSSILSK